MGHSRLGPGGSRNMGKYLGIWFLSSLAIAVVAAYLAAWIHGLDPVSARAPAKLVGAVSFIACGFGKVPESIWLMRPWTSTAKYLLDAALHGLGSGLVFYWHWP